MTFFVAINASSDTDGKINVFGMFPTAGIRVMSGRPVDAPQDAIPGLPTLSLVTIIPELPPGSHPVSGKLIGPEGDVLIPEGTSLGEAKAGDDGSFCHILNLNPFPIKHFGKYLYTVEVAGKTVTNSISVIKAY